MAKDIHHYCVGFFWYGGDPENQLPRFKKAGIWENGFDDKYLEKVKSIPVGSMLAAKTSYTRKENGKTISVLEVHGIGTVTENPKDGKQLRVKWQEDFQPFKLDGRGAYRSTISRVNDPKNIELIFGKKKKSENVALAFDEKDLSSNFPLNQILFGPPGTGKTYHTINKAVSIIDSLKEESLSKYYETRSDLKDRFDELLIDDWDNPHGQIGFVTFHQTMSYEDFIEGIKPGLTNSNDVTYDVEPGIFKKLAEIARDNWLDANKGKKEELSFEDAFQKLKDEWYDDQEMKFPLKREGSEFTILGFTKASIKFKKASGGTGHTLSISTLRDYYYNKREIRLTGVGIYYPAILDKLKSYQPSIVTEKEERNYVLIIDEINRGNVSQIFGELITLIEQDKRLGKEEELTAILPYSKERFGVPPNLYIIGTMNTADRSVEALDTALRRRFSFTEMPPQPDLLSPKQMLLWLWNKDKYLEVPWSDKDFRIEADALNEFLGIDSFFEEQFHGDPEEPILPWSMEDLESVSKDEFNGVNLENLLTKINTRIVLLLDTDHAIGHSYFITVTSWEKLMESIYSNVIPLLQEYFYGDYAKIGAILGSGFVKKDEVNTNSLFAFGYEEVEGSKEVIYKFIDYRKEDGKGLEGFKNAIEKLINNPIKTALDS